MYNSSHCQSRHDIPSNDHVEKAPTDDINVRKALIYAVDQETISQIAFYGLQPAAHSVISPSNGDTTKKLPNYTVMIRKKLLHCWKNPDGLTATVTEFAKKTV
jgi:ABC-type transport system substrate-binding protein